LTEYLIVCRGFANGESCPFEGLYLETYTPEGRVKGSWTPDPNDAMRFASQDDAFTLWKSSIGKRPDGRPDRPLTAFNVEIKEIGKVLQ
jgi:hypothetical protein